MASTLFGEDLSEFDRPAPAAVTHGRFASIAIEQSLDRLLDYAVPAPLVDQIAVGQRVRVPLGRSNKPAYGYVCGLADTTDSPPAKIKSIIQIDDQRPLLSGPLLRLARWMSGYYVTPLGTVIESIIPSAVRKQIGLDQSWVVRLAAGRDVVQSAVETIKAPKRRAVLGRLLQSPDDVPLDLTLLAADSGTTVATVRALAKKTGLIRIERVHRFADELAARDDGPSIVGAGQPLSPDQQQVMQALGPAMAGGFSVNLLVGVTGSGKTEVYLQCIEQVIRAGRQAIVMVPEIALTPQTVRRFTQRFARVAVLHSGLTPARRHRFWQSVSTGKADVVVGARSAVFAPLPRPGIIVVDEEHESSYKQDLAPRYNGRDVAIKRAQLEELPIILGSATPSLEMYHRISSQTARDPAAARDTAARDTASRDTASPDTASRDIGARPHVAAAHVPTASPQYRLLHLPRRIHGGPMPAVEIVDMRQEARLRRGIHLISTRLEHLLRTTVDAGRQAIVLLNRRGYSNYIRCSSCQHVVQCRFCDTTMTYHRSAGQNVGSAALSKSVHTGQLHCHYCLAVNPLPDKCPACGKLLSLFGMGTQRVEEEITRKFPGLRFARVDSDSMSGVGEYEKLLERFARGEVQVLLGTQMIAKGLDFPNVTLVGVISADTALSLPDFRASERTFQLLTQVAGRAGRGSSPGRVVFQTFIPEDQTILLAVRQDYAAFAQRELALRRQVGYPPITRMVRIILRDEDRPRLETLCDKVAAEVLAAVAGADVTVKGPMPCPIDRIAGYYRSQIVLHAPSAGTLQRVLASLRHDGALARSDRIAVDVDPISLL